MCGADDDTLYFSFLLGTRSFCGKGGWRDQFPYDPSSNAGKGLDDDEELKKVVGVLSVLY